MKNLRNGREVDRHHLFRDTRILEADETQIGKRVRPKRVLLEIAGALSDRRVAGVFSLVARWDISQGTVGVIVSVALRKWCALRVRVLAS